MTLKIAKNPTFATTATISVPTDEGAVDQTCRVRFRILPKEDWELPTPEFVARAVLSISDLVDDEGKELHWTEAVAARVLALEFMQLGLLQAYSAGVSGAKTGN
ncbi:hypothetical protein [Tabrizicola fusiformis]|uniref:hypothetical protein n=1 Tax=Tabrizicola sp. SY72 TaxID=2741673 RepID=UPI001572E1AA|nr:hypothetical protein [Tabrizicola sp. SY72]NTT86923.1 hypothetical protein [Tabrizicola sp. SY72]